MTFTRNDDQSYAHAYVQGTVSGEADMTAFYSTNTGRTFTPDRIVIEYRKHKGNDGPWGFYGVHVSGFLDKKNGTPGSRRDGAYYGSNTIGDAPYWVRALIKNQRPDPLLDALTGSLKSGVYPDGPTGNRLDALWLTLSRLDDEGRGRLAVALTDAGALAGEAVSASLAQGRTIAEGLMDGAQS